MRVCFFLLMILCFFGYAEAQQTDDEKAVIGAVTGPINLHYNVCWENAGFASSMIQQVNTYLKKDTLLRLSAAERSELQNKLQAIQHAQWLGKTVNGIPVLSIDTIKKVMGDSTKGWDYFKLKYPHYSVHSFSRPVFIRNNTICLIYHTEASYFGMGPGGEEMDSSAGELYFYVKTGNTWVKKAGISSYIT